MLAQPADLPEELRLAVLGARTRVLFVEGSTTSLDVPLYDKLFLELSVLPQAEIASTSSGPYAACAPPRTDTTSRLTAPSIGTTSTTCQRSTNSLR